MRYNPLGNTGLFVSELCLGTMTFGNSPGQYAAASGVTQEQAEAIIRRGFDAGINFIDTANVYAGGQSETMVGQALKHLGITREQVVLATKAEHATGGGPNDGGASRYHLLNEVKASLKRLGTDHIDLYQLHGWDPATPVEATIRALDEMVRQGLVRYVGVSNWAAWQIAKALGKADLLHAERFQSVQAYYSLAGRDLEREVVPVVEAENLGLLVYSPLAGGYLTGKYRENKDEGRRATVQFPPVDEQKGAGVLAAMDKIAAAHGTSLAAVALAWLRHQPAVTSIILGIKQPAQLDDNLKATELNLTADDLQALDAASAPTPEYPGWMLAHSSAARQQLLMTGQLAPQYG